MSHFESKNYPQWIRKLFTAVNNSPFFLVVTDCNLVNTKKSNPLWVVFTGFCLSKLNDRSSILKDWVKNPERPAVQRNVSHRGATVWPYLTRNALKIRFGGGEVSRSGTFFEIKRLTMKELFFRLCFGNCLYF